MQIVVNEYIKQATPAGPFINILVNKSYALRKVVQEVIAKKDNYGGSDQGAGKTEKCFIFHISHAITR